MLKKIIGLVFSNLPPGNYRVVAELDFFNGRPLKARSGTLAAIAAGTDGSAEDVILVPANKVVRGTIYDSEGKPHACRS